MKAMRTSIRLNGEAYFGVDIDPDGRLVVAERANGKPAAVTEYPAGDAGASALRRHIEAEHAHPHVCIRSCGAAALGLATALIPVPGIGVTLVTSAAVREAPAGASPAERAMRLARLAERL
jgi:hypothetical protein